MSRDRVGQIIADRYQVVSLIARGGQGEVYRAWDLVDQEDVALKIMNAEFASDPVSRERMFREAQAMTNLGGTAAVRVLDQRWTADAALCLVMEYLPGTDLEKHLSSLEAAGQRADPQWLVDLFGPVVRTLEAAHAMGIVHRDLKPANLLLVSAEKGSALRLLDFGFAKFIRLRGFTMPGYVAGSPCYIAPETWLGARGVTHMVDVYSLGAVLYRALGGQPPFECPDIVELVRAVTTAPRPSLRALRPELPPKIDPWAAKALAIDPAERHKSVTVLWQAFKRALWNG